ncbi:MAG TPA: adenylate/guanylate cyclase domain-containing protein [Terriglobales bacterium]|nr:adenylate/guanylate cyclase domain-containing protein [Terriglobales bacterium]
MTIRRKLSLAFAVILLLFGLNLAIYSWGSAARTRAVRTLSRALTRDSLIAGIEQKLGDLHKQITVLGGISAGAGAAAASPQEVRQFTSQLDAIASSIRQLGALAGDAAELSEVDEFASTFAQLSASWARYYQDFGVHPELAVMEQALHSDPLSAQLFQRSLPALADGEAQRVAQAKANFDRASRITDRVSMAIFLLTLLTSAGIAVQMWREFAVAMGELTAGATAWGGGRLDHRMPPRCDEFGRLGAGFNQMAASLAAAREAVRLHALELEAGNRQLADTNRQIEQQKQVSEALLRNILPVAIAEELQSQGEVSPRYFEDVTILFTDFVGFTKASESLPVEELVRRLHQCFTRFDQIAGDCGLEKLKTIGDSYLCAGGIPAKNSSHPVDAVLAAFAMVEALGEAASLPAGAPGWPVRIGIHTGPVAAGVVGIHKFAFDVWGDTVNFASRLESASEPNRINVSPSTRSRIKDFFACSPRRLVMTKDNVVQEMYFVTGLREDLLGSASEPAAAAFSRRYQIYFARQPPPLPACLAAPAGWGSEPCVDGSDGPRY